VSAWQGVPVEEDFIHGRGAVFVKTGACVSPIEHAVMNLHHIKKDLLQQTCDAMGIRPTRPKNKKGALAPYYYAKALLEKLMPKETASTRDFYIESIINATQVLHGTKDVAEMIDLLDPQNRKDFEYLKKSPGVVPRSNQFSKRALQGATPPEFKDLIPGDAPLKQKPSGENKHHIVKPSLLSPKGAFKYICLYVLIHFI
jgi:hypothetical protein